MSTRRFAFSSITCALLLAIGAGACSSGSSTTSTTSSSSSGGGQGGDPGTSSSSSGGGGGGAGGTGGNGVVDDGPPTRNACTSNLGQALDTNYGRLDGYLVSIVPMGQHTCNGDSTHVHLQVLMNGAVYDIAVNTDVLYTKKDAPLHGAPWSEGWHTDATLDYTKDLGLHSATFATTTPAGVEQMLDAELAQVNHISVFATGYGPDGAHQIHRRTFSHDGALVLNPLSANAHALLFCFSNQGF